MTTTAVGNRWARAARGVREAGWLWYRWHARRPRPRGLAVSVTGRCDLRCQHCEKGVPDPAAVDMPLATVRRLLALAGSLRVPLLLTGGEPCLHPDFPEILRSAAQRGVRLELNTNGYALAAADDSLVALLNGSVELLRISIDSADPHEHDAWRGVPGSHDRALRLLRDRRLTCRREISAVLALDLHNVAPLLELARDAGCPIAFQPLIFGSNFPDLARCAWKASQQLAMPAMAASASARLAAMQQEANRLGVPTNLSVLAPMIGAYYRGATGQTFYGDTVLPHFRCVVPYQRLTVDERGRLRPCMFRANRSRPIDDDLIRSWRAAALDWRQQGLATTSDPACRSCSCYFAENLRASAVLDPWANRRRLLAWLRA